MEPETVFRLIKLPFQEDGMFFGLVLKGSVLQSVAGESIRARAGQLLNLRCIVLGVGSSC